MWKEADILEKDIILSIYKSPSTLTQISNEIKRAKPTISKTVERMESQDLVKKTHDYMKDARKVEISINPKRIKIEKSHMFYLTYYILISISLGISGITSYIIKSMIFFLGSIIIAVPLFLMMAYEVYVKEDKVVVYKNPKIAKREKKKEVQEESKNLLEDAN